MSMNMPRENSYKITKTNNALEIAEQQYGTGAEIRFTKFTSCIGVIARKGNELTGVHLVMFDKNDNQFNDQAAQATVRILGSLDKDSEVVIIGHATMWSDNQISGYQNLKESLAKLLTELSLNLEIQDVDDGQYGARIVGGKIQTYKVG